jgi:hypothetical protein
VPRLFQEGEYSIFQSKNFNFGNGLILCHRITLAEFSQRVYGEA